MTTEKQSIYDLYATSKDAEVNGVVVTFGAAGKIRIARAGGANERFAAAFEKKTRGKRREIEAGTLPISEQRRLSVEAFAETVVLGWEGICERPTKDAEGKEIPGKTLEYSRANVIKLLTELPDLFDRLREEATSMANFQVQNLEADAGNS